MLFNIVSGQGQFATIKVTFSSGATCVCSMSPFSYTATTSPATFIVPLPGIWDITVTRGSLTKSISVDVTTFGANYDETVLLTTYLYNAGKTVPWTLVHATDNTSYITIGSSNSLMRTTSALDLSDYTSLIVKTTTGSNQSLWQVGYDASVNTSATTLDGFKAITDGSNKVTTYDISSVSGSKYIYLQSIPSSSVASSYMSVYQVYLQ